jgi:hypothetical protein
MALRLVVIDPELRLKANRMTNNPSMMVIQVAGPGEAQGEWRHNLPHAQQQAHLPPFLL